jgi:hypothetical protein
MPAYLLFYEIGCGTRAAIAGDEPVLRRRMLNKNKDLK